MELYLQHSFAIFW